MVKPIQDSQKRLVSEKADGADQPLRILVQQALEHYFAQLDKNMPPKAVYQMVLEEIEIPLLKTTLAYSHGNQCHAAEILGISRSTLRKKLQHYNLLP